MRGCFRLPLVHVEGIRWWRCADEKWKKCGILIQRQCGLSHAVGGGIDRAFSTATLPSARPFGVELAPADSRIVRWQDVRSSSGGDNFRQANLFCEFAFNIHTGWATTVATGGGCTFGCYNLSCYVPASPLPELLQNLFYILWGIEVTMSHFKLTCTGYGTNLPYFVGGVRRWCISHYNFSGNPGFRQHWWPSCVFPGRCFIIFLGASFLPKEPAIGIGSSFLSRQSSVYHAPNIAGHGL